MMVECQYVAQPSFMILVWPLRREVIGFLADDRQDVQLPGPQRRVLQHELHDVAFGLSGKWFHGLGGTWRAVRWRPA